VNTALNSPQFFLNFCTRFYTFNVVAVTGGPTSKYFDYPRAKQIAFSHYDGIAGDSEHATTLKGISLLDLELPASRLEAHTD